MKPIFKISLATGVAFFVTNPAAQLRAQPSQQSPLVVPAQPIVSKPTPAPTVQSPSPSPTPVVQTTSPLAAPTPTLQEQVNRLSEADVGQVLPILKANYVNPEKLSDEQVSRATAQGLLERLAPGAKIVDAASLTAKSAASPFRAEILDDWIGYLRIGSISQSNLSQMDSALQDFGSKAIKAAIIDLRATPAGSDYDLAAEFLKRFCPKSKVLFTVRKPSAKQERIYTSNQEPRFKGLLVVVVNRENAGAAEVIAGALRLEAQAMIVGETTRGEAVEYSDSPLRNGEVLRVATALVTLPENHEIFPNGLRPDIAVSESLEDQRQILQQSLESGVSRFVFEPERPHFNEASLAAGGAPDEDVYENSQPQQPSKPALYDPMLQHAVDLITTLQVFQQRPALQPDKKP